MATHSSAPNSSVLSITNAMRGRPVPNKQQLKRPSSGSTRSGRRLITRNTPQCPRNFTRNCDRKQHKLAIRSFRALCSSPDCRYTTGRRGRMQRNQSVQFTGRFHKKRPRSSDRKAKTSPMSIGHNTPRHFRSSLESFEPLRPKDSSHNGAGIMDRDNIEGWQIDTTIDTSDGNHKGASNLLAEGHDDNHSPPDLHSGTTRASGDRFQESASSQMKCSFPSSTRPFYSLPPSPAHKPLNLPQNSNIHGYSDLQNIPDSNEDTVELQNTFKVATPYAFYTNNWLQDQARLEAAEIMHNDESSLPVNNNAAALPDAGSNNNLGASGHCFERWLDNDSQTHFLNTSSTIDGDWEHKA